LYIEKRKEITIQQNTQKFLKRTKFKNVFCSMVIQRRIEYSLHILFLEILSFIYGLLYIYEGF